MRCLQPWRRPDRCRGKMDRFSSPLPQDCFASRKRGPSRPSFDIADDRRETEPSPYSTRRVENTASIGREHALWAEFQAAQGLLNATEAVADEETLRTRFSNRPRELRESSLDRLSRRARNRFHPAWRLPGLPVQGRRERVLPRAGTRSDRPKTRTRYGGRASGARRQGSAVAPLLRCSG